MASTSSSSVQKSFKYDVFLSFRGEDTRNNFVAHLYHALNQKSICTYKDDRKITKGKRIDYQLIESIKDSRFHIIVFSTNYADSSWCLDELVKIMECQKTTEQTAYPVFYNVQPTQVRKQKGPVGDAFAKHLEKDADGKRRFALRDAAGLAGWDFNTFKGDEAQFIQKIVKDISLKLDSIHSSIDENLVGMDTRVNEIVSSLEKSSDDVRMIGIKGMGGSGKTTLASAVYKYFSLSFEDRSFVENVRGSNLKELQQKILSDVLNEPKVDAKSVFEGESMMKSKLSCRKVLVVLDDVDDIKQLKALAGRPNWFKSGSIIIITTIDEQVLNAHQVKIIHDVKLLSDDEAFCLFKKCAFEREIPDEEYEELSNKVVDYAGGLPLTITVLGSSLCGCPKDVWTDNIKRLKLIPLTDTMKKLELSYDGLEDEHKDIFLDVACILKGETKDEAIRVLESCGFHATYGLSVLEKKSLITISSDGRLGLHNHIEEMGRNIVRRLHPDDPQEHSRLWIKEEIETILTDNSGTQATRSIKLLNTNLSPYVIMNGLRKMTKLRFIHVDDGFVNNVYPSNACLPNALRYIYWRNYPLCCLPNTFRANNLVNLQMAGGKINHIWEGNERKVLNKLRFLHLKKSHLKTFDLETTRHLETLDLRKCKNIVELHMTITLQNLKILDLRGSKVSNLDLSWTPSLEKLTLSMKEDTHLPENICTLKHLKCLKLTFCWCLEQLPTDINKLEKLEELHLTECFALKVVPDSICMMKCLRSIHLPYIGAQKLPDELGELEYLKELNIEGASITLLPDSILKKNGMCIVGSKGLLMRNGFTSFTEITNYTASCYV
ncbi:hypothetical protein R6Q59_016363 [Mikania micrantha]